MDLGLIISSFGKTLGQIDDSRFIRVLLLGVGLTALLLVSACVAVVLFLQWIVGPDATLPIIGHIAWLDNLVGWGGLLVFLGLSVFLMIPVASAITSLFLDQVAQAVEERHYPNLPAARSVPIKEAVRDSIGFLGLLIVANLLALILYAFVFWMPLIPVVLFWVVNGVLLGREYFTLAAMRHIGRTNANKLRRQNRGTVWLAGTLMAIPLTIPIMNLVIPILGAATFTHIFNGLKARET